MDSVNAVMAHKLGLRTGETPNEDSTPTTPMRQMRRALARAADKAVGLSASVLGIAEEDIDAEDLIETGPDGWVVLGLRNGTSAGLVGLVLLDPPLRTALLEMQTMGNLLPPSNTQRAVTATDAVMTVPFAAQLLAELAETGFGAPDFSPASYDLGPVEDLRTAGLVMMPGGYRSWRISIQMGGTEAHGEILMAMGTKAPVVAAPVAENARWAANLRDAVQDAPADLDAVLSRITLPIHKIEAFEMGQVLTLAGTTVGSVTLVGQGGEDVATAKLGQVAGKRAVRIQPVEVELQDDPPRMAVPDPMVAPAFDGEPSEAQSDVQVADLVEG